MHISPERDFQPDDGESHNYEPDNAVWRLVGIVPRVFLDAIAEFEAGI